MRMLLAALALVAALTAHARAQDTSLPTETPQDQTRILPAHQLEVADKEMAYAAVRLDEAAVQQDDSARQQAVKQSHETLAEVRKLVADLPSDQRQPYEAAIKQAEDTLNGGDLAASAAAMRDLRARVLQLVRERG